MSEQKRDDLYNKERKNHPTGMLNDGINRSQAGSPSELVRGGCFQIVVTIVIAIISLLLFNQCST
ncbi:DUF6366 family protein [Bacillus sp. SM2101]|uniref:DUF6366 family protein n=1 Tax=Bacillus sp. SM2101 TaxID=2805366 RepID=UPI001BDEDCA5|nr:DUF6366 family protein [Bacillus sp. SM2101]